MPYPCCCTPEQLITSTCSDGRVVIWPTSATVTLDFASGTVACGVVVPCTNWDGVYVVPLFQISGTGGGGGVFGSQRWTGIIDVTARVGCTQQITLSVEIEACPVFKPPYFQLTIFTAGTTFRLQSATPAPVSNTYDLRGQTYSVPWTGGSCTAAANATLTLQ